MYLHEHLLSRCVCMYCLASGRKNKSSYQPYFFPLSALFDFCGILSNATVGRTRFPRISWVEGKVFGAVCVALDNHTQSDQWGHEMSFFHCKGPGWHPWYPWHSWQEGLQGRPGMEWASAACASVSHPYSSTNRTIFITSPFCVCDKP